MIPVVHAFAEDEDADTTGSGPQEAVETKRIATLQQIIRQYRTLGVSASDPDEHNRQMATYLAGVPGIAVSGRGLGGTWPQFDDGPILVLDKGMVRHPDSSTGGGARPQRQGRSPPAWAAGVVVLFPPLFGHR